MISESIKKINNKILDFSNVYEKFNDDYVSKSIISFVIIISPLQQATTIPVLKSRGLVLALAIILFVLNINKILNFKKILRTNYKLPIILFILSVFFSIFFAGPYKVMDYVIEYLDFVTNESNAIFDLIKVAITQLIIIFVIYLTINNIDDLKYYLKVYVFGSILFNVVSVSMIDGFSISNRFRGLLLDPNFLGRYEVFIILILFAYLLFKRDDYSKNLFSYIYIPICSILLFLSLSRGAIIAGMIGIVTMILFTKNKLFKYFIAGLIIIATPLTIIYLSTFRIGTGEGGFLASFADVSNSTRLALNIGAWNMFVDNPIFGVGYWNFYNTYINVGYVPEGIPVFLQICIVHSWFFGIISEMGLFGIVTLLWIIYLIFRDLLRNIKLFTDVNYKMIGVLLFALLFVYLAFGLNYPSFIPDITFAILCGWCGGYFKICQLNRNNLIPIGTL